MSSATEENKQKSLVNSAIISYADLNETRQIQTTANTFLELPGTDDFLNKKKTASLKDDSCFTM